MLTSILTPNVEVYVATNPETVTTSQGEIVNEALANLKEVTELYLEEIPMDSNGQPLFTTLDVDNDDRLRQVSSGGDALGLGQARKHSRLCHQFIETPLFDDRPL